MQFHHFHHETWLEGPQIQISAEGNHILRPAIQSKHFTKYTPAVKRGSTKSLVYIGTR